MLTLTRPTERIALPHAALQRSRILVESIEADEERRRGLEAGLAAQPPQISPKFFYDEQGCALYQAICNLDEYYPTRTEQAIFATHRADIARHLPRGGQWVDLGCGDGAKSWPWLPVVEAVRYVGVDIAPTWLEQTLRAGQLRCPEVECLGVVTDFNRPLQLNTVLRSNAGLPPTVFYPGSSIGNFVPDEAERLLRGIRAHLGRHGRLLIGVDAPKAPEVLQAAYDDALGVTAAFNRNVLRVVNRELGSDFVPGRFNHRAWYNEAEGRVEMHLVANENHAVRIGGGSRRFERGDVIVTEYSYKYAAGQFEALLEKAGYTDIRRWSDDRGWFNVFVAGA
ncbi:L-histidine N(alpha)-methyltransferase [Chitinimonas koreensis]|uniref:L-histidine N(alpha)-methyltransferase n=1 Tax=Chitinimonas koreensis TaxID=356302 RepID=UPI0003F9E80A|nr:L-histidine N(alpha)-methyltransferase [Chitinimonas koreensis]QNM98105.1 L-histidine N(alpha)-methyltransferase [Chitinimonas koreensis]